MFGEIEDLSNAGSFDDQHHSIGPTLFYIPGEDDDDEGGGNGDDDENKVAEAPEMEVSFNVGVQFGLTDVTSDTALKFQGSLGVLSTTWDKRPSRRERRPLAFCLDEARPASPFDPSP